MTEAEIAGYMGWSGPGAYTDRQMKRIKKIVEEVQRRERSANVATDDEGDGRRPLTWQRLQQLWYATPQEDAWIDRVWSFARSVEADHGIRGGE